MVAYLSLYFQVISKGHKIKVTVQILNMTIIFEYFAICLIKKISLHPSLCIRSNIADRYGS